MKVEDSTDAYRVRHCVVYFSVFIMKHVRAWKNHLKQHKTLEILRLVNYSWHHKKPDLLQPRINNEHSK